MIRKRFYDELISQGFDSRMAGIVTCDLSGTMEKTISNYLGGNMEVSMYGVSAGTVSARIVAAYPTANAQGSYTKAEAYIKLNPTATEDEVFNYVKRSFAPISEGGDIRIPKNVQFAPLVAVGALVVLVIAAVMTKKKN